MGEYTKQAITLFSVAIVVLAAGGWRVYYPLNPDFFDIRTEELGEWRVSTPQKVIFFVSEKETKKGKEGLSPIIYVTREKSVNVEVFRAARGEITDEGRGFYMWEYIPKEADAHAFMLRFVYKGQHYTSPPIPVRVK